MRAIIFFALLCFFAFDAQAQTVNRKATLTWEAPTTCVGGSPIANCPVLGYSVQKLSGTSTWTQVGVTAANVLTFTHENLPTGVHTYRVIATSEAGNSPPSNQVSKTIDVPGAPGNIVITITVTIS